MKVAVVNASHFGMKPGDRIYNLAVQKIAAYHTQLGDEVYAGRWQPMQMQYCDKFYFSVIFTWDIPRMIDQVKLAQSWDAKDIEIGGPAATFMVKHIEKQTGITPHSGLDDRFEHIGGEFKVTFTSRGCPHGCDFCGVKKVEPHSIEYSDFPLAPMIGDNNILSTSWAHQQLVVEKYQNFPGKVDINSGFDVRFFTPEHYELYSRIKLHTWRFAFDTMDVEKYVYWVSGFMKATGWDRHHVTFYCLVGFPGTTPEECLYRLDSIIKLGMNPYPMRFWPLNSLDRKYVAPGWTEELLQRMIVYYQSPNIWMADKWENYRPNMRKSKSLEQEALW